jgi:hypothetical protein
MEVHNLELIRGRQRPAEERLYEWLARVVVIGCKV